jgi:hypothetical protein
VGDAATRLLRHYEGTPIDATTYHYDQSRTGWNPAETDLTAASVRSRKFGLLASLAVDGNVLAQPLLVSNFSFPDGSIHDVLIVATGHNSVYAYDAQNYTVLWQVSLGNSQSSSDVGCYDVVPEYGISGTPVIVRKSADSATIYLVAATEPSPFTFVSTLHALDLATGRDRVPPAVVAPSATLHDGKTVSFDPQNQWNRPGLAVAGNAVYIAIGSHCDNNGGAITGWMLRYGANLRLLNSFHTVETHGGTELASIWMTGFAPAADAHNNLFFATGNGDFKSHAMDWGESVLKLPPDMSSVTTSFTAGDYRSLNNDDVDLGSGGVMLLPVKARSTPPMAVVMGKAGILYLLNQDNLGGWTHDDAGALQAQPGGGGLWGGPAFYDGPSGPIVFLQGGGDFLRAWSVATGAKPTLTITQSGTSYAGYGGSLPIVSSNGSRPGTGVVWLINRLQEPFSIEAYDADTLGNPIFSAQIGTWSNTQSGNAFLTPLEANGRVYAPGYRVVQVFGLVP